MPSMRLVRYLARCGVASRRSAADLVLDRLVAVNGQIVTNMALGVAETDRVTLRGKPISPPKGTVVLMLNKPAGQVCSMGDPHNPETVLDALPEDLRQRVRPVGRLDKQTTGLLLMTDDGDLAYRLTHPSFGVEKTYRARLDGALSAQDLDRLRDGVQLDDGPTAPAQAQLLRPRKRRAPYALLEITIHEGRNRQVRRMCEAIGRRVLELERVAYGPLRLAGLARGAWRHLEESQERELRRAAGLGARPLSNKK